MGYASRSGRARTSSSNPQAHAICDRCGFRYNHVDLQYQYGWRGPSLQNLRLLVCDICLDTPQEQLRSVSLPPDPIPITNPRTQDWTVEEGSYTGQEVGSPTGFTLAAQMPLVAGVKYPTLSPLSVTATGADTNIGVTFASAHGLSTGAQIGVLGLTNYNGVFSIVVTTATAFTYNFGSATKAGSYLTGKTIMRVMNMGLPIGVTTVPTGLGT